MSKNETEQKSDSTCFLCVFSLSLHVFDALAKRFLIPVGQAVWSSHDQSNKSNCLCPSPQPHMSCKKIWLQLLLRPKGNFQNSSPSHLSEMKLSSFLRFAEICLLILNHTVSSGFMTKTNVYHIYLCHWRWPRISAMQRLGCSLSCYVDYE